MLLSVVAAALSLAFSARGDSPIATNCTNTDYPPCTVALMPIPDQYGSYRIPNAPGVPRWTEFINSITDNSTYPWTNIPVRNSSNDGGETGGGPNAKGFMWGQPGNNATEVYDCPAGHIALSFDDGPALTEDYIALLSANKVIGTFFLIGGNVVNNPNASIILNKLVNDGHQIALHTWSHHPVTIWDSDIFISETVLTAKAIYDIIGKVPRYWRPPYSSLDDRIRYILYTMGLRPVVWNVESDDTTIAEPSAGIPQAENRQGVLSTVETVYEHVVSSIQAKRDSTWSYFPGYSPDGTNSTYVGSDTTYKGFVILEHEVYSGEEAAADLIVPWIASNPNYTTTTVNVCDRIMPNASMYLPDDHYFVQFIKSITLPLTEDDLNSYSGPVFTPSASGSTTSATSTKSGAERVSVGTMIVAFAAVFLFELV
ncbi:chitin deacetylase [Physocladia obscura]|uniref:Chitin deacetylase n=1 Tax=Physocladia obscura TaxID=109957 RepID=A0AAD5SRI4_9FUNG|nr:chitin deacetylase [Physocladia obscura]